MGKLSIPISEHNKIRTSPAIVAACLREAERIRAAAGQLAGDPDGYEKSGARLYPDRVRINVWPVTKTAYRAEAKTAPLMQLSNGRR